MHRSMLLKVIFKDLFANRLNRNIKKQNIIIRPIPNRSFANWGSDKEAITAPIEIINSINNELLYLNKFETGLVIKVIDFQKKEFFIVSLDQLSIAESLELIFTPLTSEFYLKGKH